jgi:hypothetical protein
MQFRAIVAVRYPSGRNDVVFIYFVGTECNSALSLRGDIRAVGVNAKQLLKAQKNNVKIVFQRKVTHIAQDTNKNSE